MTNQKLNTKKLRPFLIGLLVLIGLSCSVSREQNKGTVAPKDFHYQTKFTTIKLVMILPFELNGVSKNFLFDTGADYSLIQRDLIVGKAQNYDGASKRTMKLGKEIVEAIKIENVDFRNTIAVNGDLKELKEQIPNFGGLIGQPIIKKANWLIDYLQKMLAISSKDLADTSFETIKIIRKSGAPYTYISIDSSEHKVIIDFGSSSEFNVPKESKLAKQLLEQYDFEANERDRYTLGGLQTITEKVGILPLIKLGNMTFKKVKTRINVSSQARIGIGFFKDCKIYIDTINGTYRIKK